LYDHLSPLAPTFVQALAGIASPKTASTTQVATISSFAAGGECSAPSARR
jgi:hypothetical protein